MKLKRDYLFLLSLFMCVLFANVMKVNAMNTGFETDHLPAEVKNRFISNSNILLIEDEPAKKAIKCFDVNSDNLIAIGQNTRDRKTICIYSSNGVFQYGYTFDCSGDFGVEWDGENLNIYYVRSDVIVSVTPSGEIVGVCEVQNTIENNSYVNRFIHASQRTVGDTEYFIGNNMGILNLFASSYSWIIIKDITGAERVIYDVSSIQLANMIATIVVVCMVVAVAVVVIAREFIKLKRRA